MPSALLVLGVLFAAAFFAPVLVRAFGGRTGWVLALAPLGGFAVYFGHLQSVLDGGPVRESLAWVPSLGIELSFYLDGLSLLMALLVSGIGTLIAVYAGGYLHGHKQLGRFYLYLFSFMAAMLGVVTADNIIALFVFWELTSITSYLLIGFNHEGKESRWKALQALLVTGLGGLALLGGLILMGQAAGSYELSEILASGVDLTAHPLYGGILILVLLGAFTKSAQVPFHFWLPNAMAAPTPVSAFLHSATMVKAGVFLLARFTPVLGGTPEWGWTLTGFGAVTMLTGALMGLIQTDLKRILAYTTLSVLGMLTMLLGLGSDLAFKSALLFLVGHALYKAALFMTAGSVDHETGTREVTVLSGLRRAMPITAAAAGLAALSKGGFPPFFGFLGKEYVYKTQLALDELAPVLLVAALVTNALLLALAFKAGVHPFWGKRSADTPKHPHEAPPAMWLGPVLLALTGLAFGLFPALLAEPLIRPALGALLGQEVEKMKLALWAGFNLPLLLSVITVAAGLSIYYAREHIWKAAPHVADRMRFGPEALYERLYAGFIVFSKAQTRFLQNGSLRAYLLTILLSATALLGYKLLRFGGFVFELTTFHWEAAALALLMMAATVVAATTSVRLTALLALSTVGLGMTLLFAFYSAPDLAVTQLLVETLTVVLFVFVVSRLPRLKTLTSGAVRLFDALVAGLAGALVTLMVLKAQSLQIAPRISDQLAEWSYLEAKGRNVVNVILVDFRALDTMGEIAVLALAALGVLMLFATARKGKEGDRE